VGGHGRRRQGGSLPSHAEHDGGRFILRDGEAFSLLHAQHPLSAIISHAGKDNAEGIFPELLRAGVKEDVDGGKAAVHAFAAVDAHRVLGATADHRHLMAAGSEQGMSGENPIGVPRLLHMDGAKAIEPFGEGSGEGLRYVLDDHNAGEIGGQGSEQLAQRLGTARRGTDRDDLVSCRELPGA
jgi:hypothetical protein